MALTILVLLLFPILSMALDYKPTNYWEEVEDESLPIVPDPKFPTLPEEFLAQVDESCQNVIYAGGHMISNMSDYQLIWAVFGGCKQLSQGYCQGKYFGLFGRMDNNNTMVVYKRSWTGYWVAYGFKQEYYPVCSHPDPPSAVSRKLLLKAALAGSSSLLKTNASPKTKGSSEPLPRVPDMPMPAPWPPVLLKNYKKECRAYTGQWNVNYVKQTEQQFYKDCNFTNDSGQYCKQPPHKVQKFYSLQNLILRSKTGGYNVSGVNITANPNCRVR